MKDRANSEGKFEAMLRRYYSSANRDTAGTISNSSSYDHEVAQVMEKFAGMGIWDRMSRGG